MADFVDSLYQSIITAGTHKASSIKMVPEPQKEQYDAIILAVSHQQFAALGVEEIRAYGKPTHILYDVKYLLPASEADGRL